jgi:multiple antibiotic resistance protein
LGHLFSSDGVFMEIWTEYMKFFAGLLSILNPVGTIPIFINLTSSMSESERHRTGRMSAFAVLLILSVSLVFGRPILDFFGITIASFRVAGGILILFIAVSMMHATTSQAKQTQEEVDDAVDKDSVAFVPLGIPLLAGPGSISTVIVYAHKGPTITHDIIIWFEIIIVSLLVWVTFRTAPYISTLLGRTGMNVITRIMGLIMAAVAVEFITTGLKQLLPGLS